MTLLQKIKRATDEQLFEIGNSLASMWGGSCFTFEIDREDKEVMFRCVEHGEHFEVAMSFETIKDEYGYRV